MLLNEHFRKAWKRSIRRLGEIRRVRKDITALLLKNWKLSTWHCVPLGTLYFNKIRLPCVFSKSPLIADRASWPSSKSGSIRRLSLSPDKNSISLRLGRFFCIGSCRTSQIFFENISYSSPGGNFMTNFQLTCCSFLQSGGLFSTFSLAHIWTFHFRGKVWLQTEQF